VRRFTAILQQRREDVPVDNVEISAVDLNPKFQSKRVGQSMNMDREEGYIFHREGSVGIGLDERADYSNALAKPKSEVS
jgi:hypothetical protein